MSRLNDLIDELTEEFNRQDEIRELKLSYGDWRKHPISSTLDKNFLTLYMNPNLMRKVDIVDE